MKANKLTGVLLLILLPIVSTIMLLATNKNRERDISAFLKIAEVAIDETDLQFINNAILTKSITPYPDIVNLPQYQNLVRTLTEIQGAYKNNILWTYTMLPLTVEQVDVVASASWDIKPSELADKKFTAISVLTLEAIENDTTTHPGTLYEYSNYPALVKVLEFSEQATVSGVVYDKVYKSWVKSGFIKIYDYNENVIGILGVDLSIETIIVDVITVLLLATIYSGLITIGIVLIAFGIARKIKGGKNGIQDT